MRKKEKVDTSNYLFDNKAVFALVVPLIIEQLLGVFVGMADSVMIASLGEAAVSGVSLVDSVMILIFNIFSALATGGAVVAGQYLGRKNNDDARKASQQLVYFTTLIATGVMVACYLCKPFILNTVFGQIDADVKSHADIYLSIVLLSIPFLALYCSGAAVFRVMGNSKISMDVSLIMNAINVFGNALLIYGLHFNTAGVAIPTFVSRVVASGLIIWLLTDEKYILHIPKKISFQFELPLIKKILYIGVPNGMEDSMFQLGKIVVLSLVSSFGTSAIAANAVAGTISGFQILPAVAIELASITVISRCIGADDEKQVKYYTERLHKIAYCCTLVTVILFYFMLPTILKLYHLSSQTALQARQILLFHGASCCIIWPIAFILPTVFRAAGDVKFCMMVSIISMWFCRIVMSYVLGKYMGLGVYGIWIAMVLDWIVRAILFIWRYFSGRWKGRAVVDTFN